MSKKIKLRNLLRSAPVFGVLLVFYFNAYAAPKVDYKNIPDVIKDFSNAVGKIVVTNLKIVDEIKPQKIYTARDEAGNKVVLNLVGKISVSPEFAKIKRLKIGDVYAIFLKINEISADKVVQGDVQAIAFPHEVPASTARKSEKAVEEPVKAEQKVAQTPQQERELAQKGGEQIQKTSEVRALPNDAFLILTGTDSETGTKFWRYSLNPSDPCFSWKGGLAEMNKSPGQSDIIGEVPSNVSLADDKIARALVAKMMNLALSKCRNLNSNAAYTVMLAPEGFKVIGKKGEAYFEVAPLLVKADFIRQWDNNVSRWGNHQLTGYQNMELAKEQAKLEAKQAASISELGPQKAAEELLAQKITKCGNSHYTKNLDPGGYLLGLYEFKNLSIQITASPLTEADKLNGIEWKGTVILVAKASRPFKAEGFERKPTWQVWENGAKIDHQNISGSLAKRKGRWHLELQIGVMRVNLKPIKCSEIPSGS